MNNFAWNIFKYRSYTPIPFLILMFLFQELTLLSMVLGFIVVIFGESIRLWGVSIAGSETRTTGAVGATYLIVSGPFAFVRNPLYVGNILIYMGIGIMSLALFPYLQLIALFYFIWQYYVIVKEEESHLIKVYGDAYKRYTENVGRFIPRLTPYRDPVLTQPSFNIKAGLKSERRTLQAITIITILLTIILLVKYFE